MKIVFVDNNPVDRLYPITLTRRPGDILCGGATLAQLAERYLVKIPSPKTLFLDSALAPDVKAVKALAAKLKANKNASASWPRFEKLSDVIKLNQSLLKDNLDCLKSDYKQYKPGVYVGQGVKIAKEVVFDTSAGPIIIADQVNILPFVYIAGPVYIGKQTKINEFASIKSGTCIGDVCKVGGEVEASIIQGYSNKQHQGVLAHSYVGEWVNIGGGISTSDLKNTYGSVKMQGQDTGEQFLGCVIGDYSKTAINIGIYGGKVIGVNSFVYDTVVHDVPSFTNHLGRLGKSVAVDIAVAVRAQKAMMARRKVKQTKADVELLHRVFALTKNERKQAHIINGKLKI